MDTLLNKDSDIIVTKSPFSSCENEKKNLVQVNRHCTLKYVEEMIIRGDISGIDFDILQSLYELEFATSRMITQHINLKGIEIPQTKIQNRIKVLRKHLLISSFYCSNGDKALNTKYHCIERWGCKLLNSREISTNNWKPFDSARPLSIMKRILARNQVLLTLQSKLDNIEEFNLNKSYRLPLMSNNLRPHLEIKLKNSTGEIETIFFEVSRLSDGGVEKTLERIKLYKEFINNFKPTPELIKPPQVVLVGEDDSHLFNLFKNILANKIKLDKSQILYTSDLRIITSDINRSLIRFNLIKDGDKLKSKIEELNYILFR
ncbi:hypothetical protein [Senegalia massiliensis]|uniref:Uncharacterized protein n=1 Tax=Senegalia massiliensis TaxID=1720316 RepID=A0A845R1P5_9CLOT|nr:hypothetical protein [Senegalia massiliensis]NBI07646.1 hypothetical protein [Senegalia massiliensis]